MTTNDDILKAMAAEKHKIMASAIKPQLKPNITDAEIVKVLEVGQSVRLCRVDIIAAIQPAIRYCGWHSCIVCWSYYCCVIWTPQIITQRW